MGRWGWVFSMLQGTVLSRLGSSMVGVFVLIALIWYAGPLLGLTSTTLRLYAIAAVVVLAVLVLLLRSLITAKRGRKLKAELDGQDDGSDADRSAEIEAIRGKMNEAIGSLKSSRLGRGSAALYALPWYMIIGPSAAGKSTLLRQSGLQFPYASSEDLHLRGFGGTRNCDWWFSDQAILLDTAGRYTTEEDDREEWLGFLDLLRRNRPKMPINGVLIAISLSDLLTADAEGLEAHVKILRERIDELMRQLGLVFPVYIVFTKCDLIQGFESYFEDLSEHERKQVWGAYLREGGDEAPVEIFRRKMRDLHARLCELRLRKMSIQRNLARKATLFDFPDQFRAATEQLDAFIELLFRANPYQEMPRFAGAYFTSGTQEGTPLQRLVGNLRQAFGYAQEQPAERTAPAKAYFIKSLFTDVIFQLQHAVHGNRRRVLWQRWLKASALTASLSIIAVTAVLLSGAFARNSLLLADGSRAVAELRGATLEEGASAQGQYQALAGVYEQYRYLLNNRSPLISRIGIYTGEQQIQPLESLLLDTLSVLFRDRAFRALEYRLEDYSRQWATADKHARERLREQYYEALKVYLMVTRVPARLDIDAASTLLTDLWAQSLEFARLGEGYAAARERAPHLAKLVELYLQRLERPGLEQWPVRDALITQAQDHLRTPPDAQRLYVQLVSKGTARLPALDVDALLSGQNRGLLVSSGKIAGLYTAKGWSEFARAEIDSAIKVATHGDWVLSDDPEAVDLAVENEVDQELATRLERDLREAYFRDYADAWLSFLATVRPQRFESLEDASNKLMMLARSDGPLGELMQVTARNINLGERSGSRLDELKEMGEGLAAQAPRSRVPELEARLGDLRRFTNAAEQSSVSEPINQYLLVLSGLKNEVEGLAVAMDVPREARLYAASVLGAGGSASELHKAWVATNSLLNGTDVRTRQAMQGLLHIPIRGAWAHVLVEARRELAREWRHSVADVYQQQLSGKFPFTRQGPDAALTDVAEFFRPSDGVLWFFVEQNLTPFLAEQRQGWQERRWLGMGLGFSPSFLGSLSEARGITQSLFRRGGSAPEMEFYVYPMPVRGLSEMVLESNGQSYRYRNEPQEWRRFSWPGDMDRIGARIASTSSVGGSRAERRVGGQWGLFRLLQDARITSEGGTVYLTEWELEGEGDSPLTARFRIRADRQDSIFKELTMSDFRLPTGPFSNGSGGG